MKMYKFRVILKDVRSSRIVYIKSESQKSAVCRISEQLKCENHAFEIQPMDSFY